MSAIIARFSSRVTPRTSVTWKAEVFPTIVTAEVPASTRAFMPGSSAAAMPRRRVIPKATTLEWDSASPRTRAKYWASFGLESG